MQQVEGVEVGGGLALHELLELRAPARVEADDLAVQDRLASAELIGDEDEMLSGEVVYLDDHCALVSAQMDIDAVNKQFMLSLPTTEDYQTLAGFVIQSLQKIPSAGEQLHYGDDLVFTVKTVRGPKVEQIQIDRPSIPLRRRPRRQPGN